MAKTTDPRIEALGRVDLFSGLSAKQLALVAGVSREEHFPAGAVIVAEGDTSGRFYLVTDGEVEVKSHGKRRVVLGPGKYFGEMAVIDKGPRSATVAATKPTTVVSLAPFNVKAVFRDNPDIVMKLLERLVARLRVAEADATH